MDHTETSPTPIGLRERKKRRTRQAIAAAALRLFAENGYDETTIAEIAAAADISPRTFFSYFPSKEDVVFAEMDDRMAEAWERLDAMPPGETPQEALRGIAVDVLEAAVASWEYGAVHVQLVLERPALQARALMRLHEIELQVAARVREMAPEVDEALAAIIAGVTTGGIHAIVLHTRINAYGPERTREQLTRALTVIEQGLVSLPAFTRPLKN